MKNRIFVIDGSSYLYRAFHAMPPLSTSSGKPTGAVKGVTNMLMNLKKDSEGSPIIVVFDAKGKTFRSDIYSEYKANRPPMPDELRDQLIPVKSICRAIGFPLIEIEGVEADDVIATISQMAKDAKYKCVISSLDKDLMQLVEDPHTTVMDTMKHKIFNEESVFEKFGVKPNQIRDMLALVGDASDNIPGVPKVGQKTGFVQHLLATFSMIYFLPPSLQGIHCRTIARNHWRFRKENLKPWKSSGIPWWTQLMP